MVRKNTPDRIYFYAKKAVGEVRYCVSQLSVIVQLKLDGKWVRWGIGYLKDMQILDKHHIQGIKQELF